MKNDYRQEVEREIREEFAIDPEDEALLRHVMDDDSPPQGLHQGRKKKEDEHD